MGVKDFDLSDVSQPSVPTGILKTLGGKLASNIITKVLMAIPEREFRRIVAENELQRAYGRFFEIMAAIGQERRYDCKSDELSPSCPTVLIIPQFQQTGRTSDGTAPFRMYTIVGDDGEIVNIQGFDLTQRISIWVTHKNGHTVGEDVSPKDAMLLMRFLAGMSLKPS